MEYSVEFELTNVCIEVIIVCVCKSENVSYVSGLEGVDLYIYI